MCMLHTDGLYIDGLDTHTHTNTHTHTHTRTHTHTHTHTHTLTHTHTKGHVIYAGRIENASDFFVTSPYAYYNNNHNPAEFLAGIPQSLPYTLYPITLLPFNP
jgi:hypothetical protein